MSFPRVNTACYFWRAGIDPLTAPITGQTSCQQLKPLIAMNADQVAVWANRGIYRFAVVPGGGITEANLTAGFVGIPLAAFTFIYKVQFFQPVNRPPKDIFYYYCVLSFHGARTNASITTAEKAASKRRKK